MNLPISTIDEMKKNEKRLRAALFVAAGLFAILVSGCGGGRKAEAEDTPTAPVVKVVRRDLNNELEIASEFQPLQEIEVYAKVSGYIKKLYVDWGTHVKEGQILAELEIPELQQQLRQDEASARRSDQDLSRAREELNRAQSAYNVAHITYTRIAGVQSRARKRSSDVCVLTHHRAVRWRGHSDLRLHRSLTSRRNFFQ